MSTGKPAWRAWGVVLVLTAAAAGPATRPATQPAADVGDLLPPAAVRRLGAPSAGPVLGRPLAFSPDSQLMLTDDHTTNLYDVATGRGLTEADAAHAGQGVAFLGPRTLLTDASDHGPDGRYRATFKVCDTLSGRTLKELPLNGATAVLAVSPDGRRAVVRGGRAAGVRLVDTTDGHAVADLTDAAARDLPFAGMGHARPACFSGDGSRLLLARTGPAPAGAKPWDVSVAAALFDGRTGRPLPVAAVPAPAGAALSGDGTVVVAATSPTMTPAHGIIDEPKLTAYAVGPTDLRPIAWDATNGRRAGVARFAFGPTGARLAVATMDRRVTIWDLAARPPTARVIRTRVSSAAALVWSPDGRTIAVAGLSGPTDVRDVATGVPLYAPPIHTGSILAMAAAPDGRSLITADEQGLTVRWNLDDGAVAAARGRPTATDRDDPGYYGVRDLRYAADGSTLLSVGRDERVRAMDPATLRTAHADDKFEQLTGAGLADDGRTACLELGSTLVVRDAAAGVDRARFHQNKANSDTMAFSPDGGRLAVVHQGEISLYDLAGGNDAARDAVTCVDANDKSDHPGSADDNSTAGSSMRGQVRFSPDGRLLVAVGDDCYAWPVDPPAGGDRRVHGVPVRRPCWTGETFRGWESVSFTGTGGLLAVAEGGGFRGGKAAPTLGGGAAVFEPGSPDRPGSRDALVRVSDHGRRVVLVTMVPGRPLLATADDAGGVVVWSLREALGVEQSADRSDAQLWDDVAGDDPAAAYRAGLLLADRRQLVPRARAVPGPPADRFRAWVAALSSPDRGVRDAAHKHLEAAGRAAAAAERQALAAHPGGEAEARLADLVRLAAGPAAAEPADPDGVRRRRVVQLLEWSDDPAAAVELARLGGRTAAAATRP